METDRDRLKTQILVVLKHPEAEEGLYFRNFFHLHEEDERPAIEAEEPEILEALHELIQEGKVTMNDGPDEVIFRLAQQAVEQGGARGGRGEAGLRGC